MTKGRGEDRLAWSGSGVAALLVLALSGVGPASAQDAPGGEAPRTGATATGPSRNGDNGPAGGQGGVGGTGLGKMPPAGGAAGTGNSVKGPPGQGITAPIDPLK